MAKKYAVPAVIGLLFTTIIWGFGFVVVKSSLDYISAEYMLSFRFTIAAVTLALVFIKKFRFINWKYVLNGGILGFFLFLSYAVQTYGCDYTTAGKNAFLTTIYVIIVPFFAWLINRKKPDIYCIIGSGIGIVGLGLLSLGGSDLEGAIINIGDLLTIVCGFGYAIHMVFIDKFTEKQDPILLTILQLAFAACFSWLLALISGKPFPEAAFTMDSIIAMLYLGIFSTAVGFFLQNVCQKYTEPSVAALLLSFEAVFGMIFSMMFLNEQMSVQKGVGCVLMFAAAVVVETKLSFLKRKKQTNT